MPKVIFENKPEAFANELCYLAKQIACGYYQDRRMLVLNHLVKKETRAVYFPDLSYSPDFWRFFKKYKQSDFVYKFPQNLIKLPPELITPQWPFLKSWQKKEKEFFKLTQEFLPKLPLEKIRNITVLPTVFGTVGSFFFEKKGKFTDLFCTVREDFGPANLAEEILSVLYLMKEPTKLSLANWYQRETVIDFLMQNSKIGGLFNFNYVPTVSDLPEIPENFVAESEQYLAKLGFPVEPTEINARFTPSEKRIYDGLLANKGKTISYDQIGEWFWEENSLEKFSLQSIAKITEKIRKKIKDRGIYGGMFSTIKLQMPKCQIRQYLTCHHGRPPRNSLLTKTVPDRRS